MLHQVLAADGDLGHIPFDSAGNLIIPHKRIGVNGSRLVEERRLDDIGLLDGISAARTRAAARGEMCIRARTRILHAHFSHIEYNDKGEVRHLTFSDTVYGPDFLPVAQETAARGYTPTFICESAGTQAEDARMMMDLYKKETEK